MKIVKKESLLKKPNQLTDENLKANVDTRKKSNTNKQKDLIPRGKPKSGKIWKSEKKKFSSIIKTKGIKTNLEKNKKLKEKLQRVKEASRLIIVAKKEENERKKERRRENLKRQEENKKKSEIVQVITNTKKLKKIKRKQLKYIEKRDVTTVDKIK